MRKKISRKTMRAWGLFVVFVLALKWAHDLFDNTLIPVSDLVGLSIVPAFVACIFIYLKHNHLQSAHWTTSLIKLIAASFWFTIIFGCLVLIINSIAVEKEEITKMYKIEEKSKRGRRVKLLYAKINYSNKLIEIRFY